MKEKYTNEDKNCAHCQGSVSAHCCGDKIIYWCDDCGSNNPAEPPNIRIDFNN